MLLTKKKATVPLIQQLLLELEQYRAIEEEDNIILTMIQDIEAGKEDLIEMSSV